MGGARVFDLIVVVPLDEVVGMRLIFGVWLISRALGASEKC